MEFSKKLMVFASAAFALTWLAAMVSWFVLRDVPEGVMQFVSVLYGATFVSYCGKSAYENRYRITKGGHGHE